LFHTIFNVLGVLLMLPVTARLTHFLEQRFVTQEEIEGRPRFLDKTVAVSPMLALNALMMELMRIAAVARRISLAALSTESVQGKRIASDHVVAEKLSHAVAEFISRLERGLLSGEVAEQLAKMLRAEQHLLACAGIAHEIARKQSEQRFVVDETLQQELSRYRSEVVGLMGLANPELEGFSFADCEAQLGRVQASYDDVKTMLLHAGAELRMPVPEMIDVLEQNSRIRRMARQMFKAIHLLGELYMTVGMKVPEADDVEEQQAGV
jgi:phosphate:Na+ symporter